MFAHGLTILIGLLTVIGEIALALDGSSSKFHLNKISDFDDIVETESEKTQIDPSINHRDIQSRSPVGAGWNLMGSKSQSEKDKNLGRLVFEKPVQYISESSKDESGYYHVEPRKAENDKHSSFNFSKNASSQVEHFACEHTSSGVNAIVQESSTELTRASSVKDSEHEDVCNDIDRLLKNPIVERLLMNTMYKSPKPADKWSTFVFIVRKMEPNTPEGLLEHPNSKECVKRYVRKRRRKRHSTATLLKRKQKMIKRLQRRDTWDKTQEDNLFKDIAKFLVSNKLKHNGYTYVPVMFSRQANNGLKGFNARDQNGDLGVKLTDTPTTYPTSKSTTTMIPTTTATTAHWTEVTSNLSNQVGHQGIEEEKVATESVAIHAGGSMVPGILIYPIGKKLKRDPLEKTELDNSVDDAINGLGNLLDETTKASSEFIPTYTLPILKRGIPPECAEDTEKLLQLLATAKDKDNPPRRMIPGILVYPWAKIKRFVLGSSKTADSSTTEDAQPTFYALDRNLLLSRAQKILKKEVPPECLKDTDQLLNLLANAIDENLTSTTAEVSSPESGQQSAESENATSEQETSNWMDQSTSSDLIDLKSLGINMEEGTAFPGVEASLKEAAPLGSETLMGGSGIDSIKGGASDEFGASSLDSICEPTQCNLESTTENNCECIEVTENSEDMFSTENLLGDFGALGGSGEVQPAFMELGAAPSSSVFSDQSSGQSDVSATALKQSSTEASSLATTNSAGTSSTAQETECVTVVPSSSSKSVATPYDSGSTIVPGSNKDDHVNKDMTKERLKRLEKDLTLVNEVEKILKGTGLKHKIRKRDLGSILDDTSMEENQTPTLEITITVKSKDKESPETFFDKPTKTVREINQQMLRGLGKLLKWRNFHNNNHNPSRPKRNHMVKRKRRRKKKRRHKPLDEIGNRDHFPVKRMDNRNRFLVKRRQNYLWGGENYFEN